MPGATISNNWIEQLPETLRHDTLQRMHARPLARGEVVYNEGQVHSALWQVRSGSVRVTNQTADGKEVIFALFTRGDCFGEITLLDGQPAANTATAAERAELLELPKADFDELIQQHPELSRVLTRFLCARMRHMLNFYADVTLRPLEQRLANRLRYLGGDAGATGKALMFTQQDLAGMVGATRPAVSKVLNRWREQGVISLEYGKIIVIQPQLLEDIADPR